MVFMEDFFNAVKNFYKRDSAYVRVSGGMSEWFEINTGVHQGYVMSL